MKLPNVEWSSMDRKPSDIEWTAKTITKVHGCRPQQIAPATKRILSMTGTQNVGCITTQKVVEFTIFFLTFLASRNNRTVQKEWNEQQRFINRFNLLYDWCNSCQKKNETLRLMVLPANDGAGSKDAIVENVFYGCIRNPPNAVIFWFWILLLGAEISL